MPRKPQQQRAKATVDAIIEAGFICIARHGVSGTTTTHIADIAGIGVGSLYEYFGNKEAVFAAMHARFIGDIVAVIQPLTPVIVRQDITGAIKTLLNALGDFLRANDERYLRYGRSMLTVEARMELEPVTRSLQDLVMQYLLHHPELTRLPRLAAMSYIFIHGGTFSVLRHLTEESPAISFDELVDGLASMVSHYAERGLQLLDQPSPSSP